jgi:ribosomal protein L9
MKLKKHFVEKVKPGTARNYLVPNKLAIYAHYLNKQEWRGAIEAAMKAAPLTDSDDAKRIAKRERTIVKRLQNLTLVRLPPLIISVWGLQSSCFSAPIRSS